MRLDAEMFHNSRRPTGIGQHSAPERLALFGVRAVRERCAASAVRRQRWADDRQGQAAADR